MAAEICALSAAITERCCSKGLRNRLHGSLSAQSEVRLERQRGIAGAPPRGASAIAGLALNAEEPVTGWGRGRRRHAVARAVSVVATEVGKGGRRVVARPRRPRFAVTAVHAPWIAGIEVRVAVDHERR